MHKVAVLEGLYLSTISCKTTVRVKSPLHLLQPLIAPCRVTVGLHTWCPYNNPPFSYQGPEPPDRLPNIRMSSMGTEDAAAISVIRKG